MPDGIYICSTKSTTERESVVERNRRHVAVYIYPGAMEFGASAASSVDDNREFPTHGDGVWHHDGIILGDVGVQIADASLGVGP